MFVGKHVLCKENVFILMKIRKKSQVLALAAYILKNWNNAEETGHEDDP